ncbi:RNA-binding protein 8A family protein [Pelomyxa schiedti]|nr:RNA-binding protein 8A family protein [Pelomyxa schiedti]
MAATDEHVAPEVRMKKRGRGIVEGNDLDGRYTGKGGDFEEIEQSGDSGPGRSIEGWLVFVTNVNEEAAEDDLHDKFGEFGEVRNLTLPLDRRTGFVKGYALVEYESKKEAESAIRVMNGTMFMGQPLYVDWAFQAGASTTRRHGRGGGASSEVSNTTTSSSSSHRPHRDTSLSPQSRHSKRRY